MQMTRGFGFKRLAATLTAALMTACGGGGGGSSPVTPPAAQPAGLPPLTGSPTTTLAASSQTAGDLATAAKAGAAAIDKVDGFSSLPLGVQVSPPSAVVTTDTFPCSSGGSVIETDNAASATTTTVGDTAKLQFANCIESGILFSGMLDMTVTRYASDTNLTVSFTASELSVTQGSLTRGPFSFSGQLDYNAGAITFSYGIDGLSVVGAPVVTRNGNLVTVVSAKARINVGTGFVEVQLSNWTFDRTTGRPVSGTATVTAAAGTAATITVGTDGYHVSIVVNGVTTTYVVPF
jgi:hypothetical protein